MIIRWENELFKDCFNRLVSDLEWHNSLYSLETLRLFETRAHESKKTFENLSFIYLKDGYPEACFLAVKVLFDFQIKICVFELPSIIITGRKFKISKIKKPFLSEIIKILEKENGDFYYRDFLYDGAASVLSDYLISKNVDFSVGFSRFINLNNSVTELKSDIRKSYKSLVNWGSRELKPKVLHSTNVSWEAMNNFRMLHIQVSGRETMTEESWKKRFEMVKDNKAFVVLGYLDDQLVTAGFFIRNATHCYYGSSASKRELFDKPIFHSILWRAILHAREIGCSWFELGDRVFSNDKESKITEKDENISKFKSGFGGASKVYLDMNYRLRNRELNL
jgi:hypothetical protein